MSNSKLNAKYQLPPPSAWTLLRVMHLSQKKGGGYKPIRNKASAKGPVFIATKFYAKSKLLPDKPTAAADVTQAAFAVQIALCATILLSIRPKWTGRAILSITTQHHPLTQQN